MAPVDPTSSPAASRTRARKPRPLGRRLAAVGGALLLGTGLVVFVTPIPFGGIMVGVALAVLIRVSPTARLVRRTLSRRYPDTARRLEALRQRVRAYLRR
ncbi:hypothetical protein [Rhodovibrio salinarum]|uniref:Transmembrane protein (PGPGW) n=1 Tax=Rhodovibrio salinarum TaxID=1087 RepID=A0A934UYX4_9PROT|nr:hypothetical protein [Rhodovibrio salinarum]MBK1695876.1 hypothetical protein [Rhodovibrio salinarum]